MGVTQLITLVGVLSAMIIFIFFIRRAAERHEIRDRELDKKRLSGKTSTNEARTEERITDVISDRTKDSGEVSNPETSG